MRHAQAEKPLTEAEEIEAMLPWLVTGTLSRADEERVTRYLETHPEAAAHVALAREEHDAAIDVNESIPAPRTAALDRLMASIATTPQQRQIVVPTPSSVWESIASFLGGLSPRTLGFAATTAVILLVVQATAIGLLATRDAGKGVGGYTTASGSRSAPAQDGIVALVTLQPGVTASALTAALVELKGSIVEGPTADGYYRVRMPGVKADSAVAIAKLKAKADIFGLVIQASR